LAFTKQEKTEILAQYEKWVSESQAIFIIEYSKMSMKDIDAFRAKAREAGGQVHVCKNTLLGIVLDKAGINYGKMLEKTSLVAFVSSEAPAVAKVFSDATKNSEVFKLKGGVLDGRAISPAQVKSLADMPPLPVLRAQLLGVLQAPASKLVRTLAEPARQMAAVVKAYSEKEAAVAAG
jgi:large subunit ribosomal protein L10